MRRFVATFQLVALQLVIQALELVPVEAVNVTTPTQVSFEGVRQARPVCGISILRAGASMEDALRTAYNGPLSFGKILIQRDEETCLPTHLYSKLPSNIAEGDVFILEPMLATGGSICKAIDIVQGQGVPLQRIVVVSILASEAAIQLVLDKYPGLHIVTAAIDERLNARGQIEPGLGDFGDRFYGTF
ncbi:hypothetical protein NLU13_9333 [Sarocladium strictum]|uniref:uracil phosphoribosyltransferase n=1 Tax=Sarocladium strictum TaxID=5046 RepID=A0AA39GAA1_SARSR|nr:hypothetical protein NLU13_9333 [Sarocladium strictum]